MAISDMVALGARIPAGLKEGIMDHCDRNGIKMRFFVTQALQEKLMEVRQSAEDNKIVNARIKDAEYVGAADLQKYASTRKKKA